MAACEIPPDMSDSRQCRQFTPDSREFPKTDKARALAIQTDPVRFLYTGSKKIHCSTSIGPGCGALIGEFMISGMTGRKYRIAA